MTGEGGWGHPCVQAPCPVSVGAVGHTKGEEDCCSESAQQPAARLLVPCLIASVGGS